MIFLKKGGLKMRLSLHQLKVFQNVADLGGITAAARKLHMTQPAVSNILKQIQEYYQEPLIETIGKKIYLTQSGKIIYQTAVSIEKLLEKAHLEIHDKNNKTGDLSGNLSLSIVSTAKYFVPKLLGAFQQENPKVAIQLQVLNREQVIERLKQNKDDFVIMSQPPSEIPIDIQDFYEDELVLACSPQNTLANEDLSRVKNFNALEDQTWLIREQGSGTRAVMLGWIEKKSIPLKSSMEIGNNESIKQMIMANMGISLISKQSIALELSNHLIKLINLKGLPLKHEWYMVRHANKQNSVLVERFYEFVQQHSDIQNLFKVNETSKHGSLH